MIYPELAEFIRDISSSSNPVLAKLGVDIAQAADPGSGNPAQPKQAPDPVHDQAKEQENVDPTVHDKGQPNEAAGKKTQDVVDMVMAKPMPEIEVQEQVEKQKETFGKSASMWDVLVQQFSQKTANCSFACDKCKKEFDYCKQPEVAMGSVKCPHCGAVVHQNA